MPRPSSSGTAPKLTDIIPPGADTDQDIWVEGLTKLQETKGRITVMHLHDIHAPFQHHQALDVAYQLVEYAQPDVIVVGSDFADFALLSTFTHDPDLEEDTPDELEQFAEHWDSHILKLKDIAPNALLPFIYGNHEWRILRYLEQNAPKLRRSVLRLWEEHIQSDGDVLYLGEVDWVRMGPLLVMHGNRVGVSPAKAIFGDVAGQVCVQSGHVHRLDEYVQHGEDYNVWSKSSGCLCRDPHYQRGRQRRKWQLGTSVMYVDLNSRYAKCDNLQFQEDGRRVWVEYERNIFECR